LDTWKFFDITHTAHVICNPLSLAKMKEMLERLDLPTGARALDIACGKAEWLLRLAGRCHAQGVGVDISPFCVRAAREKAAARLPDARLQFVELDGARYEAPPESFDVTLCIGATWVFGGYRGTLRALQQWTRPGGQILVGEPYWRQPPAAEYLAASGLEAGAFNPSHAANVADAVAAGLQPLYALPSSETDWDRYEGLQWWAAERYAATHGGDPDVPELLARVHRDRDAFLRWGRDTLGWAVYLFRRP